MKRELLIAFLDSCPPWRRFDDKPGRMDCEWNPNGKGSTRRNEVRQHVMDWMFNGERKKAVGKGDLGSFYVAHWNWEYIPIHLTTCAVWWTGEVFADSEDAEHHARKWHQSINAPSIITTDGNTTDGVMA